MRSEEFSQPCDADEIQPFTDNGKYGNCDSSSTKKRCDLTCNEGNVKFIFQIFIFVQDSFPLEAINGYARMKWVSQ